MPCPQNGPCTPFITSADLCCLEGGALPDPCIGGTPVPAPLLTSVLQAASEVAWTLTGRQFGTCDVVVRPCFARKGEFSFLSWTPGFIAWPYLQSGEWFNYWPCSDGCSCHSYCEVLLPNPVCAVTQVRVDGVVLASSEYVIKNNRTLVRVGDECWPRCNDLTLPATAVGTWDVAVTYGRLVPEIVQVGTAELACQLLKACLKQPCDLPQKVRNVARQGTTLSFDSVQDFLEKGKTGIYSLDLAITSYNPNGLARRAGVWSPDVENWSVVG